MNGSGVRYFLSGLSLIKGKVRGLYLLLPAMMFMLAAGWSCTTDSRTAYPLDESVANLIASAERCADQNPDSALIYYSIAAGKYEPSMSDEEKRMCVKALHGKWRIYFYNYFDYAESYSAISEAQSICEENGFTMPEVKSGLGILYWTLSEECKDPSFLIKAFINTRSAFREAMGENLDDMHHIASNVFYGAYLVDSLESVREDMKRYSKIPYVSDTVRYHHNLEAYKAFIALKEKDYDKSVAILEDIMSLLPETTGFLRHQIITLDLLSQAYKGKGDERKAREMLEKSLEIAERHGVKDACVELYGDLSKSYRSAGLEEKAKEFDSRQLLLQDTLIGFRQLSRINDIDAGREIKKIEVQITALQGERQIQRYVIGVFIFLLVLLACLLLLLFNRNRSLKEFNRRLYSKNQEILAHTEEERKLRKAYEVSLEAAGDRSGENVETPYSGSPLDERGKKELMERILSVMDDTEEYLSPDFSLERLTELAGSKYRFVSQVINEKRGCNFNSFVNSYRIKEACRRISDIESYGHLTLDAISRSVGFRARSSFVGAFKLQTGMTPSQYQKIAREESRRNSEKISETDS